MNAQTNNTPRVVPPAPHVGAHLIGRLQRSGLCRNWDEVEETIEALITLLDNRDGDCDLEEDGTAEEDGTSEDGRSSWPTNAYGGAA